MKCDTWRRAAVLNWRPINWPSSGRATNVVEAIQASMMKSSPSRIFQDFAAPRRASPRLGRAAGSHRIQASGMAATARRAMLDTFPRCDDDIMTDTYDTRTIALHWGSALLVLCLWIIGQGIDWFPKGTPRMTVRSVHITFGLLLALLLLVRLAWRRWGGVQLPAVDAGALGRFAAGTHLLLYALLAAAVVAGMASAWIRGDTLFNLITVPALDPTNKKLAHNAVELHGLIGNGLLGLAAVHAAAAVWHHRVLKDGVLRRMWPALPAKSMRR